MIEYRLFRKEEDYFQMAAPYISGLMFLQRKFNLFFDGKDFDTGEPGDGIFDALAIAATIDTSRTLLRQVRGFVTLEHSHSLNVDRWELGAAYILKSNRKSNHLSAMVDLLIPEAKRRNIPRLDVDLTPRSDFLYDFFTRRGFVQTLPDLGFILDLSNWPA